MTRLGRKLQRLCMNVDGRDLVVAMHPGSHPVISMREKGCRNGFEITVGSLFTLLALREADRRIAVRRGRRRKKK